MWRFLSLSRVLDSGQVRGQKRMKRGAEWEREEPEQEEEKKKKKKGGVKEKEQQEEEEELLLLLLLPWLAASEFFCHI